MTTFQDVRKSLTETPFYAWVGLLDTAVDQVRTASDEAGKKAAELREQFKPELVAERAQEFATDGAERVQSLPKRFEAQSKAVFAQAEESYAGLSKRGENVVAELRKQQEAQTKQVIDQGKATAASARKVAGDAQEFATKSVLTGRKEAAKQVEAAADKLGSTARTEVRSTAARTAKPASKKATKKAPAKRTAKKAPAKRTAKKTSTTKA